MVIKEEYKIKYQELRLTGNIPKHPKYLYEYELPNDFERAVKLVSYVKDKEETQDYSVYLNRNNELVLSCNIVPVVLGYKPEGI